MSIDTHIKFDGVEGEATHKDHKGQIQVLGWSWDVTNQSQTAGGGSGKGRGVPGQFSISKLYDKSTPVLSKHCASGKHFPTVTLVARKSGEGQKDFLKVTMKEVFITRVDSSATSQGDIQDTVAFTYSDIEFEYKPQDDKGGLGGAVKFGWNIKEASTR